jgi:hypothetical protein
VLVDVHRDRQSHVGMGGGQRREGVARNHECLTRELARRLSCERHLAQVRIVNVCAGCGKVHLDASSPRRASWRLRVTSRPGLALSRARNAANSSTLSVPKRRSTEGLHPPGDRLRELAALLGEAFRLCIAPRSPAIRRCSASSLRSRTSGKARRASAMAGPAGTIPLRCRYSLLGNENGFDGDAAVVEVFEDEDPCGRATADDPQLHPLPPRERRNQGRSLSICAKEHASQARYRSMSRTIGSAVPPARSDATTPD